MDDSEEHRRADNGIVARSPEAIAIASPNSIAMHCNRPAIEETLRVWQEVIADLDAELQRLRKSHDEMHRMTSTAIAHRNSALEELRQAKQNWDKWQDNAFLLQDRVEIVREVMLRKMADETSKRDTFTDGIANGLLYAMQILDGMRDA